MREESVFLLSLSLSLSLIPRWPRSTGWLTLITCLASIHRTASSRAANSTKANPLLAPTLEWRPQQTGVNTDLAMADDGVSADDGMGWNERGDV